MMRFVQLLPANRQHTFLINRGMMSELAAQVEKQQSWAEAAAVCEEAGDLIKASELYEANGRPLAAAELLLRQVRLLLLWPESAAMSAAVARQHAVQLLMRSAQLLAAASGTAETSHAAQGAEAEAAVLAGLAQGFASAQQVKAWVMRHAPSAAAAAEEGALGTAVTAEASKTQLLVAVEGFAYALRLTVSSSSTNQASNAAAALQLVQQWQQLLSVLLPLLSALDAALRLSDAPSPEQQQLLAACEFYMCVRPSSSNRAQQLKIAERSGMLWCLGLIESPAAAATAAAAQPTASSSSSDTVGDGQSGADFSGSTLQLNMPSMLQRAAAYWRWWLADQGAQLASYLEQQWTRLSCQNVLSDHSIDASSSGSACAASTSSSSSSSSAPGLNLHLLLQAWEFPQVLLQQVLRSGTAIQHSHSSSSSSTAAHSSTSISAATAALTGRLVALQQSALQQIAAALLMPQYTTRQQTAGAAASLRSLLQQPHMAQLVHQLAAAVLEGSTGAGGLAAARKHHVHSRGDAIFRRPPPPPQPECLTYDRTGQICLLAPLLDPYWVPRAALQGSLMLRQPAGPQSPVPWLRLCDVFNPPAAWTQYYPVCQYAWRCCIGVRDYLECLGVLPAGLSGGFMPHTLCALLELAVTSACAVTTGLHNLVLPQAMVAGSMSGQGLAALYSWVVWHDSSRHEKVEMQQELLRLSKQVAALLVHEEKGFPAWCKEAASVLGFQAGLPATYVSQTLAYEVQEATAQQLFWLLFAIAANNRPPLSSSSSGRPPLSVQIRDCFLDTLASLAGHSKPVSGSSNTAFCLLPDRLKLCVLKLLARAGARSGAGSSSGQHSRSSQYSRAHGLQFEEVAAELLATAATGCSLPWVLLYRSTTGSSAPHWARKLRAIMVDQQAAAAAAQGEYGCQSASSLFCVEQLVQAPAGFQPPAAAASSAVDALPATHAVAHGLSPAAAAAAAPAGDLEQQQQQVSRSAMVGRQRPDASDAEHDDSTEEDAAAAPQGRLDDGDDAATFLAGAGFLQGWVHWRLRCWKARAVAKLNRQLSPLQQLQAEARAALRKEATVPQGSAGNAMASSSSSSSSEGVIVGGGRAAGKAGKLSTVAAAAADEYLQLYLSAVCPVMVSRGAWVAVCTGSTRRNVA
jgi:hypothetical protein